MKQVLFTTAIAALMLCNSTAWAANEVESSAKHAPATINIVLKGRLGMDIQNTDYMFNCNYLRLDVTGTFAENFRYRFRQRFNKPITDGNFLSATDYLWVGWEKNGWGVSAGKNYVACGGFEYMASSIDIYIRPIFFSGLGGMYNYVLNGTRTFCGEKLTLQVGNSLYSTKASELMGYSLMVEGQQGVWEHLYSVNLFERPTADSGTQNTGLYNAYVCLGNRFHFGDSTFDIGLTHRFDIKNPTFFKDFSMVSKFKVPVLWWMNVFGKVTWDYKQAGIEDPMLADGTNIWQAGGGFEFFPARNYKGLRLHCVYYNQNGNLNCALMGMSITLDIVDSIKQMINR